MRFYLVIVADLHRPRNWFQFLPNSRWPMLEDQSFGYQRERWLNFNDCEIIG